MKLQRLMLADIEPYRNNPRKNDEAVNAVAESIRQCSYITPIIVDENYVIIAGHTRYKALVALGMDDAECLICDGLTEEQKKIQAAQAKPGPMTLIYGRAGISASYPIL